MQSLNGDVNLRHINIPLSEDKFPRSTTSWSYRCINLYEYFTGTEPQGIEYSVNRLELGRNGNLWIDEASIQQGENHGKIFTLYMCVYTVNL